MHTPLGSKRIQEKQDVDFTPQIHCLKGKISIKEVNNTGLVAFLRQDITQMLV